MTGIEQLRKLGSDAVRGGDIGRAICDIADQIERERDAEVADSPYDAILPEDREAIAWVREHGGLETVEARLMPEGMEWPRYEDGEPVRIWDKIEDIEVRSIVFNEGGILLSDCTSVPGWGTWRSYKERVRRPAVLAADGEQLEVGQTVWKLYPHVEQVVVKDIYRAGGTTVVEYQSDGVSYPEHCHPSDLTHTKPEIDNWERVEEDAGCTATKYNERRGTIFTTKQQVARDLVRRCRALAERERGEA